jgi:predicted metal-dependent peptidase
VTTAPDIQRIVSASLLRLRMKSPFFATLALFTDFHATKSIATAATDGQDIFFNPDYISMLAPAQVDFELLHQVLHAALLHPSRRGTRDEQQWNVAADIVVNGMIAEQQNFELPTEAPRSPDVEHLSVEEIYELITLGRCDYKGQCQSDLLKKSRSDRAATRSRSRQQPITGDTSTDPDQDLANAELDSQLEREDSLAEIQREHLEAHWRNAMQQAVTISESSQRQGDIPAGMQRELGALNQAKLDWRTYLWRYLVRTPTDFSGFDRRFVGRKLYLEALESESVQVFIAIDTSGSISDAHLKVFLSEVQGILTAYPHLVGELYFADAEVYGPYPLDHSGEIPVPTGGGGTSFVPFFAKVRDRLDWHTSGICVYLTDGYGVFPHESPELPVLWVVTPGGLAPEQFPFGDAICLHQY